MFAELDAAPTCGTGRLFEQRTGKPLMSERVGCDQAADSAAGDREQNHHSYEPWAQPHLTQTSIAPTIKPATPDATGPQ